MSYNDFHVHTFYCDGKDSPEDIVRFAIDKGIKKIGFSGHSYVSFDDCCMSKKNTKEYISEINRLKKQYFGYIDIYLGVELDYYSNIDTSPFEFIIGSVHYVKVGNNYLPVDESEIILKESINKYFDGNIYAFIDEYYNLVADIKNKTKCNIIGHFDLISKYNYNNKLFNDNNNLYISAWKHALNKINCKDTIFEINSGAISRGYTCEYYPTFEIRKFIKSEGGKFIFSSDSHSKNTLCFNFDKMNQIAKLENLNLVKVF